MLCYFFFFFLFFSPSASYDVLFHLDYASFLCFALSGLGSAARPPTVADGFWALPLSFCDDNGNALMHHLPLDLNKRRSSAVYEAPSKALTATLQG